MKNLPISSALLTLATACGLLAATGESAKAATFKVLSDGTAINTFLECINDGVALVVGATPTDEQGWQYAVDSFTDGVNGNQIGGNAYEIYSLAVKETEDSLWVALNANTPLTGILETSVPDNNIGWGDMFFNFSGKDFTTATKEGDLFGVRFASTNDSYASVVGVYGDVKPTSTTSRNNGFNSLQAYNQAVAGYNASIGDLPIDTSYFNQKQSINAIHSGQFLTDINYVSPVELSAVGYDLNRFDGQYTIGFTFDKSVICDRGYCEMIPDPEPDTNSATTPEPSSMLGFAVMGLVIGTRQLYKRHRFQ